MSIDLCDVCHERLAGKPRGVYDLNRLCCCVALVESTRPLKTKAEAMLAKIARNPSAPDRKAILAEVARRRAEESHKSPSKST